jgi:abequosyltransferase
MHTVPVKLSICIPTFNRASHLRHLTQSILLQDREDLEIVISDNASTDETMEVVAELRFAHRNIRYVRNESNIGADMNLLNAVSNARGEYCWLMGSDDIIEPGAVQAVLAVLSQHSNLAGVSVNLNIYTRDLVLLENAVPVAGGKLTADYLFRDCDECFSSLGLYFGFYSAQVVNRRLWGNVVISVEANRYSTEFVLVYIIGHMLRVNPHWYFLSARCVGNRTGNDSFLQAVGFYQRQVIAHDHFERTLRAIFPRGSKVYRKVLKIALSTYIVRDCVGYKASGLDFGTLWLLILLYTKIYKTFALYWFTVFPILISPRWVIKELRRMFRFFMRKTHEL